MAENKPRRFKISSTIENLDENGLVFGESEKTEISPVGTYIYTEEECRISYEESGEGGEVKTDIFVTGELVKVIRRGAVKSEMHFSEGKTHASLYEVTPYSFDTTVYTKKIRNTLTKTGGRLDIFYTMTIGGQQKVVRMRIEC